MKKLLGLILLLCILGGVAYYLVEEDDKGVSYDVSDSEFTVPKDVEIKKIFLAFKNKPSVKLEMVDGIWMYNDKYPASDLVVKNLLLVFRKAKVSYIPAKAAVDNIYKGIGLYGIKVEVFGKENKLLKSYYIGGNNNEETATFFLMNGAKQPYAMKLNSLIGNLRDRFKLDGSEWRERYVFGDKKEDIKSITVKYPKYKSKSFVMKREEEQFKVSPFYKTTKLSNNILSTSNIESYLIDIEEKLAEAIIDDYDGLDSLNQLLPFCQIELEQNNGIKKEVKFVLMNNELNRGFGGVASHRYFALFDNGDLMLTQNRVVKTFFRSYDYFFIKQ